MANIGIDPTLPFSDMWTNLDGTAIAPWRYLPAQLQDERTRIVILDAERRLWNLAGPQAGQEGAILSRNISGLMHAPSDIKWTGGPYMVGETAERVDYKRREISFGVTIGGENIAYRASTTPSQYRQTERDWWQGWDEKRECWMGVFTTFSGWRWLRVRFVESKTAMEIDPTAHDNNVMQWDITVAAAFPFWTKPRVHDTWVNTEDQSVMFGHGEHTFRVANRGDFPAFPIFTVSNPGRASIQDGQGGKIWPLPLTTVKAYGNSYMVDTDPAHRTIVSEKDPVDNIFYDFIRSSQVLDFFLHDVESLGQPLWRAFDGFFTTPIPPRTISSIKVRHDYPNGRISMFVPQRFRSAY